MLHPTLRRALATAHIEDLHRAATPRLPEMSGQDGNASSGLSKTRKTTAAISTSTDVRDASGPDDQQRSFPDESGSIRV
jgi:hypothetical protein